MGTALKTRESLPSAIAVAMVAEAQRVLHYKISCTTYGLEQSMHVSGLGAIPGPMFP